jgi:hypothetical protein
MMKISRAQRQKIAQYEAIIVALRAYPRLRYDRIAKTLRCGRDKVYRIARNNGFTECGRI